MAHAAETGRLIRASETDHFEVARTLFEEYAAFLQVDLCFQQFEAELANLRTMYHPPAGYLLLAYVGEDVAGVVGLRPLGSDGACEMKRMYVRPAFRGHGLGRQLAEGILDAARELGYTTMHLDTLERLTAARRLYADLGFVETEPYYNNPLPGVRYMAMVL